MPQHTTDGPFDDPEKNEVWRVLASTMHENYEQLADMDMLEQTPANHRQAMNHPRLKPFWMDSERKEMDGLWKRGCFKIWKRKDLLKNDRVFGSRFHYNIKRDATTGHITNCKV